MKMRKTILILALAIFSVPMFAELTTDEILMEAQKVSFKHEGDSRFVVSDSTNHYIIYKDDAGQFSVEGVFKGHLVKHNKVDNMFAGYEHYAGTYFAVLENGTNKIYYKDEMSDLYDVKVENTQIVQTADPEVEPELEEEEDEDDGAILTVKISNPDDDEDEEEGKKGGRSILSILFTCAILYWIFFD